jgi:anaphase-promoting complex subunit 1
MLSTVCIQFGPFALVLFLMLTSHSRCNDNFQEFCSQVLYECMSKDRPALLQVFFSNLSPILLNLVVLYHLLHPLTVMFHFQVYISFYTIIESMWEHLKIGHFPFFDSLFLSSLKVCTECSVFLVPLCLHPG